MSSKKRKNESWQSYAERLIVEGQQEGKFDNIEGFGKPIPGIDDPSDDMWWVRKKLKDESLPYMPPILAARKLRATVLASLDKFSNEMEVREKLDQLNDVIRNANFSPNSTSSLTVFPVDIEEEVAGWKARRP